MSLGLSQAFRAASRYMPRRSLATSAIVLLLACSVVSWENYMDAGYDAHQGERYAESEEMFLAAAQLTESFSSDDERRAMTWNNLADLYRTQARYREAEPLYRRALESLIEILGPKHLRVAGGLNNLAGFYLDQESYSEAEPLYWSAVTIVEDTLGPVHPAMASSLTGLAAIYHQQDRHAEAEPLYQRVLTILESTLEPEDIRLAELLEDYATLLHQTGRDAAASEMESRARAIRAALPS